MVERNTASTVLYAGLVAGALDLLAAIVTWAPKGVRPVRILQAIASGLLGRAAFGGGWRVDLLGLACHFFIAIVAAAVFVVASRYVRWLTQHAIMAGTLYGIAVYAVMYHIVLPLSRVAPSRFSWIAMLIAVITHIVCVGLPIALITRAPIHSMEIG